MGGGEQEPFVECDHQRVSLVLAQSQLNAPAIRSVRTVQCPIPSQNLARVHQALLSKMIDRNVSRAPANMGLSGLSVV